MRAGRTSKEAMADSESLRRFLSPLVLHLQKMEVELKCLICLNLLNMPQLLPCDHVFCRHCIKTVANDGICPICNASYLQQDIRTSVHMGTLVNIYKSLNTVLIANFQQLGSQEMKMASNESPVSANMNAGKLSDELIHKLARESEACTNNTREEAFINKGCPCSSQSSGDMKDSDRDSNYQRSEHKSCSAAKHSFVKDLNDEANESENTEIRELKRQKLASVLDSENAKDNINAQGLTTFAFDSREGLESHSKHHSFCVSDSVATYTSVKCVFCHSFKITETSGPMMHYVHGIPVTNNQLSPDVFHVHQRCIEWAPQVYFSGDTAMNLEAEVARAAKIKCSHCGLKGAALGCYVKSCRRSFHVPCAVKIPECRWDCDKFLLLCPAHSSHKLPCDRSNTKTKMENRHTSTQMGSYMSSKKTTSARAQIGNSLWTASAFVTSEWVLSGSALLEEEKNFLNEFVGMSGASISKAWKPNITHVIASTNEHGACSRTFKVLMAILAGKWVLRIDWIKACIKAGHPVSEEPYEVTHDVNGAFDGPRIGRTRAMEKAPKLFSGLSFYLSGYYMPYYRGYIEDLISAAGGMLLQKEDVQSNTFICKETSTSFVVYSVEPPQGCNSESNISEVARKRAEKAEAFASQIGARPVQHTWLLDTIASCSLQLH